MRARTLLWGIPTLLVSLSSAANATVLTFDMQYQGTQVNNGATLAGLTSDLGVYGDRVPSSFSQSNADYAFGYGSDNGATPNVAVSYGDNGGQYYEAWDSDYGDLQNVIYQGVGTFDVEFTADPGYEVSLYSFDMAGWPETDYTINSVSVIADGVTAFEQSNVQILGSGPSHTSFDFPTAISGRSIILMFDAINLALDTDNVGIDNISFGQSQVSAIPVPAALPIMGIALAGFAGAGWRQRSRSRSVARKQ